MTPRAWLRRAAALDWHRLACTLLGVWAIGIVVAVAQLETWQRELTRTLLQLSADAQFRTRLAQQRDAVAPEWYRRKALALLSATETMRHDTAWTLFMPGSWRVFDDVEERAAARIEREFADIVVETIRLELIARAAELAGLPRRGAAPPPGAFDCQAPAPKPTRRTLSGAVQDLPEYAAVRDYVLRLEQLDAAVQAFFELQQGRAAQPQQLHRLVKYTLGAELRGPLQDTVPLFHGSEEVSVQPALMLAAMQWTTRCSLYKGMNALHARLLASNQLLALEQALQQRSSGLFDAAAKPKPFDRTLERYRAVAALLDDQHALLARGGNDWMRQATLQLGPGYEDLLARLARMRLAGPDVIRQLDERSGAAFAEFRRQFQAAFGRGEDPGIVWNDARRQFELSGEREALRAGLAVLLQQPFMAEDALGSAPVRTTHAGIATVLPELRSMVAARQSFVEESLPQFPGFARDAVERAVDTRVSDLVYQAAYRAFKAAMPGDATQPLDATVYQRQGELVAEVQELLEDIGADSQARRLGAAHSGELLRRFALLQEEAGRLGLYDARAGDFAWWQGDAAPVWQVFGASDGAAAQQALAGQVARLETLAHRATALLAMADEKLARDPVLQRWKKLAAEVDRYRARQADSSLLALERYVQQAGADFRRDNCAERLALQPVLRYDDDIAQRLLALHNALATRCGQLRLESARPLVPPPPES